MRQAVAVFILAIGATTAGFGSGSSPLLLRHPTLSKTQIAFEYGGDIWVVSREGGRAERLVTGVNMEFAPIFSPDGSMVAYTGMDSGNPDVYVVSAGGGEPTRLTYHPGADVALGWTPDGTRVLLRSPRYSYSDPQQLFTIPLAGGFPTQLPLPMADDASFSPDGTHLAYVPVFQWEPAWKRYHGGQTKPIWIANLADSSIQKVPRENSNDFNPMWVGDKIYFLSDRAGPVTLFEYDIRSKQVKQCIKNDGFDLKTASAGPGAIVYEQFGSLHLYDLSSGKTSAVHVQVAGDMPQTRPHFLKIKSDDIQNADISPTGVRAVFEAHGEVLTVPAKKGDVRNITNSPAVADRDPSWSPDGKWIAYFSDESGEYALHIRAQNGLGAVRKIDLGKPPSFFYKPVWSPDSKKIAYTDKRLNLWYVDTDHPAPVKVATDLFDNPLHEFDQAWSPDSRWIAYVKQLPNHLHAVFVYSIETAKSTQITDGMSDALYPSFDRNGKYLYFAASTNMGLTSGWLDMTSIGHPVTRSIYVVVLRKDLPSPIAPESDDEKAQAEKKPLEAANEAQAAGTDQKGPKNEKKEPKKPAVTRIDFENIGQRVLAMPIPAQNYRAILAGEEGVVYLVEAPLVRVAPGPPSFTIQRFDLKTRKTTQVLTGVQAFDLSADGKKMLYEQKKKWFIAASDKPPKPGQAALLKTEAMEVYIDPPAEWRQMYHEVWRIERDFFYDPHFHGLDLAEAERVYRPFLAGIASRDDLNYLFEEMTGNMTVGHMFIRGGQEPDVPKVSVGLLGADYAIENNRYRFKRIYNGENWNPQLHAPLTQPGVSVQAGEYLLAVNGRELYGADNVYRLFQETAGKQTAIKVGPNPNDTGSREVTVVPIATEFALRNLAWIEANRLKVDRMTGGKVAYVYLPDTAGGGYTNFNRYYFAQVGKQAAILDERFNHGGDLADYIIDYLRRPPMSRVESRQGDDYTEPVEAIFGPKVMIINQFAGSGGDALPWYFRKAAIGPLIGHKTWGGLVGIGGYPPLIDGGRITAPRWAIYGLRGHWDVENHGIAPDIAVDEDPALVREGHDPQLERAVEVVLELLKKSPPQKFQRPPYPNYHQKLPSAPSS